MKKEIKERETYEAPKMRAFRVAPSSRFLQTSVPSTSSFGAEDAGDYTL